MVTIAVENRSASIQAWASLLARVCLSALFLLSGFTKVGGFAGTTQFMSSKGVPAAELFLIAAIAVELTCGIALLVGWRTRWAALLLAGFVIVITPIFHGFWAVPPEQYQMQLTHFLKNLAIVGGLLGLVAFGAGALSADASPRLNRGATT